MFIVNNLIDWPGQYFNKILIPCCLFLQIIARPLMLFVEYCELFQSSIQEIMTKTWITQSILDIHTCSMLKMHVLPNHVVIRIVTALQQSPYQIFSIQ